MSNAKQPVRRRKSLAHKLNTIISLGVELKFFGIDEALRFATRGEPEKWTHNEVKEYYDKGNCLCVMDATHAPCAHVVKMYQFATPDTFIHNVYQLMEDEISDATRKNIRL